MSATLPIHRYRQVANTPRNEAIRQILAECQHQAFDDVRQETLPHYGRRVTIAPEALNGAMPLVLVDVDRDGKVTLAFAWRVDLGHVNGPTLGPYRTQCLATYAESRWLAEHTDLWD